MGFYFDSWSSFFMMEGHGPYVWAAFLITWAVLIYLLVSPVLAHRRWLRREAQRQRRSVAQNRAEAS